MDHDAIFKLLSIEEKSRNHPKLKAIHDEVLSQLHEAAAVVEKQVTEKKKAEDAKVSAEAKKAEPPKGQDELGKPIPSKSLFSKPAPMNLDPAQPGDA